MKEILILHGAIGSSSQFISLKEKLSGRLPTDHGDEFKIHLLDFEGHGERNISDEQCGGTPTASADGWSASRRTTFRIENFAENVLNFIDEKRIHSVNIFGYSMGGYVALQLALLHPHRVNNIMTLATKFNWNPETALKESKMLNAEKMEEKIPAFAKTLETRHQFGWKRNLELTAEMMIHLGANPLLTDEKLKTIPHKCLICVGENDSMVSVEETKLAADSLPNAAFKLFPNTQHPIEKVDEEMLVEEMRRFF